MDLGQSVVFILDISWQNVLNVEEQSLGREQGEKGRKENFLSVIGKCIAFKLWKSVALVNRCLLS